MMWFIKTFWRSITFGMFLLGLLFVPSDISDAPSALSGWRKIFAMFDVTTALAIFSALAMAYIVFIDARPLITQWRARRRKGLKVLADISWSSGLGEEIGGVRYFPNIAHLVVVNDTDSGRTIEDVRVRSGMMDARECVERLTGSKVIALHSGEYGEFVLGKVIATRMFGRIDPTASMSADDLLEAEHNVSRGHRSIKLSDNFVMVLNWVGMPKENQLPNPLHSLAIVVSAKDTPPIPVRLVVDQGKLCSSDEAAGNPFQAAVVR
jgi:hypothetical protein